jgi:hypothetical protein
VTTPPTLSESRSPLCTLDAYTPPAEVYWRTETWFTSASGYPTIGCVSDACGGTGRNDQLRSHQCFQELTCVNIALRAICALTDPEVASFPLSPRRRGAGGEGMDCTAPATFAHTLPCCGTVSLLWHGLRTVPQARPRVSSSSRETFGRQRGTVRRPCHNRGGVRVCVKVAGAIQSIPSTPTPLPPGERGARGQNREGHPVHLSMLPSQDILCSGDESDLTPPLRVSNCYFCGFIGAVVGSSSLTRSLESP